MLRIFFKRYAYPVSTLSGSIIGVGFLSLPYVTLQVGIWPMIFYFIIIGALVLSIHIIFGEISLRTPDYKRFPGFVGYYFGNFPKFIALLSVIFGSFGVLLAYLIVGGQFLHSLFSPFWGGQIFWYTLFYFIIASFILYFGIKVISRSEFWVIIFLLTTLFILSAKEFSRINFVDIPLHNNFFGQDWKTFFLPFGPLMFSLWGTGMIPEIEEMILGTKRLLKGIIIAGTLIPAVIYLIFIFLVLGISGHNTSESALTGLAGILSPGLFALTLLMGLAATFAALITQGLFLKKTFIYDLKINHFYSWALTCFIPIIVFLSGFNSFIPLISFIGGFLLGLNGIFILLMYRKIGGKKNVIYPLFFLFLLGIIHELVYFFK